MLRTAPPETVEQAHEEAFAKLTPQQRRRVLADVGDTLPEAERATADDPCSLARMATRAEMRQPGTMERALGGAGRGAPGMGGMLAGSLLAGVAGAFVGSAVADAFLGDDLGHDAAEGDPADGDPGGDPGTENPGGGGEFAGSDLDGFDDLGGGMDDIGI
ncbi:MAG: hypothetical protein ACR2GH_22310 [Pseudonocardia sp.]